jgi:hypothetical protein
VSGVTPRDLNRNVIDFYRSVMGVEAEISHDVQSASVSIIAAQYRSRPRNKLGRLERFADILVSSTIEGSQDICRIIVGCQEQCGGSRFTRADLGQQREPISIRKPSVDHDQIEMKVSAQFAAPVH